MQKKAILLTGLLIAGLSLTRCSDKTINELEDNDCVEYNLTFLNSGTTQELYDIFFLNADRGWPWVTKASF